MGDQELVHVVFDLEVDDEGWPPVSGERVWAEEVVAGIYRLRNAPWFVRGIAEGDVVLAEAVSEEEWPRFVEVVERSGNCTVRVIPFRNGPLEGDQEAVLRLFEPFGVGGEAAGSYPIVALTISPDAPLQAVKALLVAGESDGSWAYEEGCITDEWSRV